VAWLDPTIITKWKKFYLSIDVGRGASYGNTIVWPEGRQPGLGEVQTEVQDDLDKEKFDKEFVVLISRPTAGTRKEP
jgi:hypothetical protein